MAQMDHLTIVQPAPAGVVNEIPEMTRTESVGGIDNPSFESPRVRKISHHDMGPVRKKSILHNAGEAQHSAGEEHDGRPTNGDVTHERFKKHSVTESMHSKTRFSDVPEDDRSWWFTFCFKCRKKEQHPSWQPGCWPRFCPYPYCPTYRQMSRLISLSLILVLAWGVVYAMVGKIAAPGGQLFDLTVLTIGAHIGGWMMSLTTLPALIGMLIVGVAFRNLGFVEFSGEFGIVTAELRKIALVIILTRAGLDLDPVALKRLKWTTMKLSVIPWAFEAVVMGIVSHFLLGLPWIWGILLGVTFAAVAPAVVVPCLFRLRVKGYGVAKGIPTLIIAIAGIDDALSVAFYGIIASIMFTQESLTSQILRGPISIIGGIGFGILWGLLASVIPERNDPFVVPLRIIMLLGGGLFAVLGSEVIGYGGAGPLAVVALAFVSLYMWSKQGWDIEDNPAATAFEIFWMIFEPILFGITGAQVKFSDLDIEIVGLGIACMVISVIARQCITILTGIGCNLNLKEKVFIAIALMAKATVQAALGPVALHTVGDKYPDKHYAEIVFVVCILCIVVVSPTCAILITFTGKLLLNKTRVPHIPEGWRRSHRPSIRDISIIDEEIDKDDRDPERPASETESHNKTPL